MKRLILCLSILIFLAGCTAKTLAPVETLFKQATLRAHGAYRVQPGDTLSKIAWRTGKNFHDLAKINGLSNPNQIYPGQILKLTGKSKSKAKAKQPPAKQFRSKKIRTAQKKQKIKRKAKSAAFNFAWPAKGKIISRFSQAHNKGIKIAAGFQSPIRAAADGEVVYRGNALKGYGNLLILKHSDQFLTAYAHNHRILVSEGARVRRGQKIALMGKRAQTVLLHFEIRYQGKPVDPLRFLPQKP